jgi:hypothetical protein
MIDPAFSEFDFYCYFIQINKLKANQDSLKLLILRERKLTNRNEKEEELNFIVIDSLNT